MKSKTSYILLILIILGSVSCKQSGILESERTISFDSDWKFIKDDPEGAENASYDDSGWRSLDLPHDWSIEDLPDQSDSVIGPFSKASTAKMRTGYTLGGTGWYRKTFTIDRADSEKTTYLNFDGVFMNSEIWVNGKQVGRHPYGYTSFYFDITPYLNPAGQSNLVAVRVRNEGETARWYSGSGIYRHTWLTQVSPVHIGMWGVYVTTPLVDETSAEISVKTTVVYNGDETTPVSLLLDIIDPDGRVAGSGETELEKPAGATRDVEMKVTVRDPALWSLDDPQLYKARVMLQKEGKEIEVLNTTFGIRTIAFTADQGFLLNGKPVELVGGCFHHDNGPLGAKAIDRAEERKIELFKNAGYNAIRCSHNPPSPYLLDVCDRLGMLVLNEAFDNWEQPKVSEDDYSQFFKEWWKSDIDLWVRRDRNHPSVIMWSIGNEIREALDTAGLRIATELTGAIRELDNTRGVTEGFNDFSRRRGQQSRWHDAAPHLALLDVVGYNYMYDRYVEDHKLYPERVMVATEFMPLFSLENWKTVEDYSYVIGNFAWVVMDYLGEAGVGLSRIVPDTPVQRGGMLGGGFFSRDSWPVFNDYQGDIDLVGNKKSRYYHQLVVWRKSPVEMLVHEPIPEGMKENVSPWGWPEELKSWNWKGHEGEAMQVHVYTRSPLVRLELNGEVIGEQMVEGDSSITATFSVPYEPGILIANSYNNGILTGSDTLKTTGNPAGIRLVADRTMIQADRNDLSYVMAEIIDTEGNVVPSDDDTWISFDISGNAEIAGVGSGNPGDMSSFQQPRKKAWRGKCLAIVRPLGKQAGTVSLQANAEGLTAATIEIDLQ